MNFRASILKAAAKRIIFTTHALEEMNNEEEIISVDEVKNVLTSSLFLKKSKKLQNLDKY